jgi:glycosyltransferase involved in cell wall biosynthesis
MRPIRFCFLTTFYPPWHFGGDAVQVARLAQALTDRGHEVTVVHSPHVHRVLARERPAPSPDDPAIERVPLDESVGSLVATFLTGRPIRARAQLERVLERGFDVLHFHNPSLLGAPAALAMGEGVKLYTTHEQWLLCASHVLWRRRGGVCEDPPCWSCELSHLRPPQLWRRTDLLRRSLSHVDALIAPSRSSARLHRRFGDLTRIELIEHFVPDPLAANGARLREPLQSAAVVRPDRPFFLYAGRLEPIKGLETLLDAFARRPSEDLVIAGDGGLARSLRRAARRLPNVHFTGWLSRRRLDLLFSESVAVLVPSLGHETFGLAAVEGFSHGTPAIVRRFGALGELAATTEAAIAYDSADELDAALEQLASDAAFTARLGERARAAYLERFTTEAHLRRYLGLIGELARERGDDELAAAAERGVPAGG